MKTITVGTYAGKAPVRKGYIFKNGFIEKIIKKSLGKKQKIALGVGAAGLGLAGAFYAGHKLSSRGRKKNNTK